LVLTGGSKSQVGVDGTFVFDFQTREWAKVATQLRRRRLLVRPHEDEFETVPWEFKSRTGHTMTAVSDHEAVVLFGKRGLTWQEKERVERVGQERAENAVGGLVGGGIIEQTLARLVGQNDELNAIWDAEPLNGYCPDAYLLDADTWTYTKLEAEGVPPAPRKGHTAFLHPDGKSVLVFGGVLSSKEVFEDVDEECTISDDLHVLAQEWRDGKRVWDGGSWKRKGRRLISSRGMGRALWATRWWCSLGTLQKRA
jgi:hypothetical protein